VRRKVAVIYAIGTANSARAAKAATATIPIVFSNGSDPIKVGLVTSMNRPDGNATGVINFISTLVPKRLEMLHELVPQANLIGFLTNPANPLSDPAAIQAAARGVGQQMIVLTASTVDEIDKAFAAAAQQGVVHSWSMAMCSSTTGTINSLLSRHTTKFRRAILTACSRMPAV